MLQLHGKQMVHWSPLLLVLRSGIKDNEATSSKQIEELNENLSANIALTERQSSRSNVAIVLIILPIIRIKPQQANRGAKRKSIKITK
jgi:hypothetical protein